MYQNITNYLKKIPQCLIVKGEYTDPKTQEDSIIPNNSLDLLYIDLMKMDPSKDGRKIY